MAKKKKTQNIWLCTVIFLSYCLFTQDEEDIDMDTVHDSQAFIYHHLNMLERPSTPGMTEILNTLKTHFWK